MVILCCSWKRKMAACTCELTTRSLNQHSEEQISPATHSWLVWQTAGCTSDPQHRHTVRSLSSHAKTAWCAQNSIQDPFWAYLNSTCFALASLTRLAHFRTSWMMCWRTSLVSLSLCTLMTLWCSARAKLSITSIWKLCCKCCDSMSYMLTCLCAKLYSLNCISLVISLPLKDCRFTPKKVAVVKDWPVPKDKVALRKFSGLANYFRKFIMGWGNLVSAMRALFVVTDCLLLGIAIVLCICVEQPVQKVTTSLDNPANWWKMDPWPSLMLHTCKTKRKKVTWCA